MRLILADFNFEVYFVIAKFLNLALHQVFQIYNIYNQLTNSKKKKMFILERQHDYLEMNFDAQH